jgi:hypothetical protein
MKQKYVKKRDASMKRSVDILALVFGQQLFHENRTNIKNGSQVKNFST